MSIFSFARIYNSFFSPNTPINSIDVLERLGFIEDEINICSALLPPSLSPELPYLSNDHDVNSQPKITDKPNPNTSPLPSPSFYL